MGEPIWVTRQVLEIIHIEQLAEHGGRRGIRDEDALESALARPRQLWTYRPETSLAALGAALCYGLVKDHAFVDGNKRVGFLALYVFLALNGIGFEASDDDVVRIIEGVASGDVSEAGLAEWVALASRRAPE